MAAFIGPPEGPSGIFVPIELDTSKAVKQFEEFGETIKKAELRPNTDLDDFFAGVESNAKGAGEAIKKFQLDMRALSQTSKSLGSSISSSGAMTEAERNRARAGQYRMPSLSGATPFSMNMGKLGQTAKDSAAAQAAEKLAHAEEYRSRMGTLSGATPFSMNMGSLAQSAYKFVSPMDRPPARSNEYGRYVGNYEAGKKSTYENKFQNRYLSGEIQSGALQKQITSTIAAEREARRLLATQDKLLGQSRLMYRQTRYGQLGGYAAHVYGENQGGFHAAGSIAGKAGTFAGLGAAGLVASGFAGTTEGERFARELRVLSLELAASFKPLMDMATKTTRSVRKWAETLNQTEQDRIMHVGSTAGGAYLGYRFGGAPGALAGSAIGYGLSTSASAEQKAQGKLSDYTGAMAGMNVDDVKSFTRDKLNRNAGTFGDAVPFYGLESRKEKDATISGLKMFEYTRRLQGLSGKDREDEIARIRGENKEGFFDSFKTVKEKHRGAEAIDKVVENLDDQQKVNDSRRKLMITEGVGFAGAGSTWQAMQEDIMRTDAAVATEQSAKLERIANGVEALNK